MNFRNYHKALTPLVESIHSLQDMENGIQMTVMIGSQLKQMNVFFPIAFWMGDGKSSDMLCCRIAHYEQPRMSRACYCTFDECDDPYHQCVWVTQAEQHELLKDCEEEQ